MKAASAQGSTLLLCVDLQPVFLQAIAGGAGIRRRCEFTLAVATGLELPVVFSEQAPEKLGGVAPELRALAPTAPIFAKDTFSALANDRVRGSLLDDHRAEHLLLCGIETPVCVYQTALDALAAGLEVTLLSDCIGARRADDARVCTEALARAGVHVLPSETVFYSLLHHVRHPFFKTYTQLVKSYG